MTIVYLATLFFSFVMSLVPAAQFLLEPVFDVVGLGAGFKTPFIDFLIVIGMVIIYVKAPAPNVKSDFVKIFKWWVPWLLYLLISSGFTDVGFWKFQMYVARLLLPTMAIVLVYLAAPDKFERYFFGLMIFLVLLLVPTLLIVDFDEKDFYNNIWLSRALAICSLYLFVTTSFKFDSIVKLSLIGLFFVSMVLIGSRGPVLSFILSAAVFFMIKNRKNIKLLAGGGLSAVVLATLVIQISDVSVSSHVASFLTHGKSENIEHVDKADDRTGVYPGTIDIVLDNPITGVGLGNWHIVYYKQQGMYNDGEYKYPHNFMLEIASELGLIGLILFLILFKPYKYMFNLQNNYNIFILLGLLFASTSSDITQNSAPMIFMIISYLYEKNSRLRMNREDVVDCKFDKESIGTPVSKYESVRLRSKDGAI